MNQKVLKDRLAYPHKLQALKHLLRSPSLGLSALSGGASVFCLSRALKRIVGTKGGCWTFEGLPARFVSWARDQGLKDPTGERILLYRIVREYQPEVVVETGVARRASSALILCAMHQNRKGRLYSIDLPPCEVTGEIEATDRGVMHTMADGQKHLITRGYRVGQWVPEYLKDRWTLILGDAKRKLPSLCGNVGKVSIFLHDSLHTYEHMMFEYETAWPHIEQGGLLLSHDILWNDAFLKFSKRVSGRPVIYRNLGAIRRR